MTDQDQRKRTGTPCTPRSCAYGPGHACDRVYPENFGKGDTRVWTKLRAGTW